MKEYTPAWQTQRGDPVARRSGAPGEYVVVRCRRWHSVFDADGLFSFVKFWYVTFRQPTVGNISLSRQSRMSMIRGVMSNDSPSGSKSGASDAAPLEANATALHDPVSVVVDEADDTSNDQDPENLGRRFFQPRTLISFGLALVIIVFVFSRLNIDPALVWSRVKQANVGLLLAAGFVYYSSLFVRGLRWKMMLGRVSIDEAHGYPMPGPFGMFHIIFLSWFANCVVPARLGDAYRSFLLKQKNRASFGTSLGTILAERLIDLVTLIFVLLVAGIVVFGTKIPHRAEQAFLIGAAVVIVGVIGVIVLFLGRERFERWMPDRFTIHYQNLSEGIFEILKRPLPYGIIGGALWMFDGVRVMLVAWALNSHLTIAEATVVALLSALATAIPLTPGGAGTVEAFMIIILPWLGIRGDEAAALALLDRVVTYWSLIAIGLPVYIVSLRHAVPAKSGPSGKAAGKVPTRQKSATSYSAISQATDSDV